MSETVKNLRLAAVAKDFNLGLESVVEHLHKKGFADVESKPMYKLTDEMYSVLLKDFRSEMAMKEKKDQITIGAKKRESLELGESGDVIHHLISPEAKLEPSPIKHVPKAETAKVEPALEEVAKPDLPHEPVAKIQTILAEKEAVETPIMEPKAEIVRTDDVVKVEKVHHQPTAEVTAPTSIIDVKSEKKVEEEPATPLATNEKKVESESEPVSPTETNEKAGKGVKKKPAVKVVDLTGDLFSQTEQPTEETKIADTKQVVTPVVEPEPEKKERRVVVEGPKIIGKLDLSKPVKAPKKETPEPEQKTITPAAQDPKPVEDKREFIEMDKVKLEGPKIIGKLDLSTISGPDDSPKKKRKRIKKNANKVGSSKDGVIPGGNPPPAGGDNRNRPNQGPGNRPNNPNTGGNNPNPQNRTNNNNNNNNSGNNNRPGGNNPNNNRPGGVGNNNQNNNRPGGGFQNPGQNRYNNQGGGNRPGFQNRNNNNNTSNTGNREQSKEFITEKEIQDKIKSTMAKLQGTSGKRNTGGKNKFKKSRHDSNQGSESDPGAIVVLPVTEFISVSELASLMNVSVSQVINTCMSLGAFVSINQRLDAEIIELVADEFGFDAQFIDVRTDAQIEEDELVEDVTKLLPRAPIVTIMGHVDHGKTSLLDHIRKTNVIAGEMGGITQHIGAYEVTLENKKKITFLDTPGHEAFTAMRARGAKVTDIAVIVIAADDAVMPQTKEAISHAQAAQVPMIFAINKIDKPGANPERIREQLSQMNILVEDWGGKYQCQEIAAKSGKNIDQLLEKILLEAEMLELKANPDQPASGTVIEASLDKGRGYVTTLMVLSGTLKVGDYIVTGPHSGKVKAMFNERGQKMAIAGPSSPVSLLGLNDAPQAGEKFKVYVDEAEAKEVANRREQIIREQGIRTKKHITLDEIGRRLALGNFQELKVIVKGDVDGSVEALKDSLLKLSTDEIMINVIHSSVGAITESDVLLASASDAVIIGFQVRPSGNARKIAEKESIDIRLYSIIYDAIEELKSAMEGMLKPTVEEKIVCNIEVREVFKISKVGTIAGCYVLDGLCKRDTKIRIIRDGIVVHTGELDSLKRFKDDVKEVKKQMECGLNIKNFNDIRVGDIIEGFEQIEVKRTLN